MQGNQTVKMLERTAGNQREVDCVIRASFTIFVRNLNSSHTMSSLPIAINSPTMPVPENEPHPFNSWWKKSDCVRPYPLSYYAKSIQLLKLCTVLKKCQIQVHIIGYMTYMTAK